MGAALVTFFDASSTPPAATLQIAYWPSPVPDLGWTNYLGVAGGFGQMPGTNWHVYEGTFTKRSKNGFRSLRDGSSNILAIGEALGGKPDVIYRYSWMGCGSMPTAWGLPDGDTGGWWQFDSHHPGVVQFCIGDGAVKGISRTIDSSVYIYLSGIHDGKTTPGYP
jgi:hypothetical protein